MSNQDGIKKMYILMFTTIEPSTGMFWGLGKDVPLDMAGYCEYHGIEEKNVNKGSVLRVEGVQKILTGNEKMYITHSQAGKTQNTDWTFDSVIDDTYTYYNSNGVKCYVENGKIVPQNYPL